jgi:hypothetical protein
MLATMPPPVRRYSSCLGWTLGMSIPAVVIGLLTLFVLGLIYDTDTDADRAAHPIVSWLFQTIGLAILFLVCIGWVAVLTTNYIGIWRDRLRGQRNESLVRALTVDTVLLVFLFAGLLTTPFIGYLLLRQLI